MCIRDSLGGRQSVLVPVICPVIAVQELIHHGLRHSSTSGRAIRHGLKHADRRLVVGTSKSIHLTGPERSRQVPYLLTEREQLLRRIMLSSDEVQCRDVVLPVDLHLEPWEATDAKDLHQRAEVLELSLIHISEPTRLGMIS